VGGEALEPSDECHIPAGRRRAVAGRYSTAVSTAAKSSSPWPSSAARA
jgi:hypothetical protein